MGKEKVREITLEYNPDQIDEQEEIWDFLEDQTKKDVIKSWKITGDRFEGE